MEIISLKYKKNCNNLLWFSISIDKMIDTHIYILNNFPYNKFNNQKDTPFVLFYVLDFVT